MNPIMRVLEVGGVLRHTSDNQQGDEENFDFSLTSLLVETSVKASVETARGSFRHYSVDASIDVSLVTLIEAPVDASIDVFSYSCKDSYRDTRRVTVTGLQWTGTVTVTEYD